jgi:hypothetical protein
VPRKPQRFTTFHALDIFVAEKLAFLQTYADTGFSDPF